ncbi:MAG TPA: glycosyltransferase [Longimicrobiales bacterium]|nr:glycosyltransferase [Longimicrobiales bacterium]
MTTALDILALVAVTTLAVTWVVYPLAIGMLATLRPRPFRIAGGTPERGLPSVSVVIASRDGAGDVARRVDNCLASSYAADRLEVVVALDRSSEPADTRIGGGREDRVRTVAADPPGGKASALNAGVRAARGEIIVFADTYQMYEPVTIRLLVDALGDGRTGAVSGRLELPPGRARLARTYWAYERWLRRREAMVHSTIGATGAVYAVRRELWQPLPAGLLLDDVYTPMRVVLTGLRVGFVDDARALETRSSSPDREYRRKVRTLTGVIQVAAWLPAVLSPLRNPVWAQFVLHKLARMLTPLALLVVAFRAMWELRAVPREYIAPAALLLFFAGAWTLRSSTRTAQQVRDVIAEAALLQAAVVMAGVNGIRGRWKVWE